MTDNEYDKRWDSECEFCTNVKKKQKKGYTFDKKNVIFIRITNSKQLIANDSG